MPVLAAAGLNWTMPAWGAVELAIQAIDDPVARALALISLADQLDAGDAHEPARCAITFAATWAAQTCPDPAAISLVLPALADYPGLYADTVAIGAHTTALDPSPLAMMLAGLAGPDWN